VAGKGGGAWKVAYADFVTAMMAFFLVMWIAGQDQSIRRAVSFYFNDPLSASLIGNTRKANRTGSVMDRPDTGSVPLLQSTAMGKGRNPYLQREPNSVCTKLVSDWLHADKVVRAYWQEQAQRQRDLARWTLKGVDGETIENTAIRELSRQLKDETKRDMPARLNNPYHDLLIEALVEVNWTELAEEFLAH
jgi:chemotaxis protein MotB